MRITNTGLQWTFLIFSVVFCVTGVIAFFTTTTIRALGMFALSALCLYYSEKAKAEQLKQDIQRHLDTIMSLEKSRSEVTNG